MGVGSSALSEDQQLALIKAANFKRSDVQQMYDKFNRLDKDQNGTLERSELIAVKDVSENPLVKKVINTLDLNADDRICFQELLVGFAKLSLNTSPSYKVRFVFDLYDVDKDGHISYQELLDIMRDIVASNLEAHQLEDLVARTIIEADLNGDQSISYEEFRLYTAELHIPELFDVSLNAVLLGN